MAAVAIRVNTFTAARYSGRMQSLSNDFWNLRGTHRIGGVLDIGTHMSVVRRPSGRFAVIDGIALDDAQKRELMALTDQGRAVDAVVHVHPFHTLHVDALHRLLPDARLYGTERHRRQEPALPWSSTPVEMWEGSHPLADVFELSVPQGVCFVCPDERVHTASVLVRHRASQIVHVDDTLNVMAPPGLLRHVLPQSSLRMHPMLKRALEPAPGSADAFAAWTRALAAEWADTRIVCAAHSAVRHLSEGGFQREVLAALARVSGTLERHRERYG